MSKIIKLRKGFDIKMKGKPAPTVVDIGIPETVSLKPSDFNGLYIPKVVVNVGDTVQAGSVLFHDKKFEQIKFTSPVSGEVVEVLRGDKRKLLAVTVLADKKIEYKSFEKFHSSEIHKLSKEFIQQQLLESGAWVNIVQRPFGIIADPDTSPKSIFISAFDTSPLAPDYSLIYFGNDQYFHSGIDILTKLTNCPIHVNTHASSQVSPMFSQVKNARVNRFSGKHPSGCVGVQIHHIDPINKGDVVWTISPFGVIQIGKLFLTGQLDHSKIVALTGSQVINPQYYSTITGGSIKKLISENIKNKNSRFISGNPLTGTNISDNGHLNFFDNQITVLPEGNQHEFLGWMKPTLSKLSIHRAIGLLSFLAPNKEFVLNTNMNGEPRAFVLSGVFENLVPMDILPTHLLKSALSEDIDELEELGIYEVIEEDLALCEFADVSKHNVQKILREALDLVRTS